MEFPHDVWLPLLLEAGVAVARELPSAWSRFIRHKLFDRHLLTAIERARCSEITLDLPMSTTNSIRMIGPLRRPAGFWYATSLFWSMFQCPKWKQPAKKTAMAYGWLPKPVYDDIAQRWVVFNTRLYRFEMGRLDATDCVIRLLHCETGRVKEPECVTQKVPFMGDSENCPIAMWMDVPGRRIYVLKHDLLVVLDPNCDIVDLILLLQDGAVAFAVDPKRQVVYVKHNDGTTWSIQLDTHDQTELVWQQCGPPNMWHRPMLACAPNGMLAHIHRHRTICVHHSDGRLVRQVPIMRSGFDAIEDMFVDVHLDVMCVAQMDTVTFVACSTLFAPPES